MPLRFLVPAFLLGLAALVIPILVHLTRRQKARVLEFPSLMFLEQVPFRAESRRKIHHWLLLLLRALAVALIVAAFARPFFKDEELAGAAASGPREVVVLLDRSYSMGLGDRWERALESVRDVVRGLGPLDRVSIVSFARNASVVVRSISVQAGPMAALDTMTVSDESTAYGPGLKLAQTILEETDLPRRELVMVGDFQRGGWTGDEGVSLPWGTVVIPVVLTSDVPADRAVAAVSLARQRMEGRDRVTATARLTRLGGESEENADVILELEGRELQRRTVALPANGAATVSFEPFNVAQESTRGAVRFAEADDLTPDDVSYFVLSPGRSISVLVLNDGARGAASSLFMSEALAISEENSFDVTARATGGIGQNDLEGVSVVVVNDRPVPGGNTARASRGPRSWRTYSRGRSVSPWTGPMDGVGGWDIWITIIRSSRSFADPGRGTSRGPGSSAPVSSRCRIRGPAVCSPGTMTGPWRWWRSRWGRDGCWPGRPPWTRSGTTWPSSLYSFPSSTSSCATPPVARRQSPRFRRDRSWT
jgi:hypothetical protein